MEEKNALSALKFAENKFYKLLDMYRDYTCHSCIAEKWGATDTSVFWGESTDCPLSSDECCFSEELLDIKEGRELTAVLIRDSCGGSPHYLIFENELRI